MTTIEDIEKAIEQLALRELARFRVWFETFGTEQLDVAIERTGKLNPPAILLRSIQGYGELYISRPLQTAASNHDTLPPMKTKKLTEVLERVEAWPPEVQNELAEFALELDAGFKDGEYEPTPEELVGIDRGLRDAAAGRFATDQQVEAVFAKFRGK